MNETPGYILSDVDTALCDVRSAIEKKLGVAFIGGNVSYEFQGNWISSVHGMLSIDSMGGIRYRDQKYNSRMPSIIQKNGSLISVKTWIEAMPQYDVIEGYEEELFQIGYVNPHRFVLWNSDGSLVMQYIKISKAAQQVDSAEASTIAVPPFEPSGSPR